MTIDPVDPEMETYKSVLRSCDERRSESLVWMWDGITVTRWRHLKDFLINDAIQMRVSHDAPTHRQHESTDVTPVSRCQMSGVTWRVTCLWRVAPVSIHGWWFYKSQLRSTNCMTSLPPAKCHEQMDIIQSLRFIHISEEHLYRHLSIQSYGSIFNVIIIIEHAIKENHWRLTTS